MNEFIKQNKHLLKFYCTAALIIGWLLIVGGIFWFILIASSFETNIVERPEGLMYLISSMLFDFVLPGLIALGVMQFIRYVFADTDKPGRILGMADWLFYLYAVFLIFKAYFKYIQYSEWYAEAYGLETSRLLFIQPFLLPTAAKVLILVGLGQIIRRIIPVIEESKTLV
ncbi:MAG: hypothetical protein ACYSUX_12900 [Planctomycetota bacterium]|jgi:hypothetical protein